MFFSRFIALRIYRASEPGEQVSRPAVLIAMIGIAIGLAVMIISVAVIAGFKSEIRDKIVGSAIFLLKTVNCSKSVFLLL